jgi:hypothetical protein
MFKKLKIPEILILVMILCVSIPVFASMLTSSRILTAKAIILNGTANSTSIASKNAHFTNAALLATLGNNSNVTIIQQSSLDNSIWYTPILTNGTAIGTVATNLNTSSYITFTPIISPYIRLQVFANSNSTVTLDLLTEET